MITVKSLKSKKKKLALTLFCYVNQQIWLGISKRSSLENCTSDNTRWHDTTRLQHETTRHNTSTTWDNTRHTSTTRDSTSTIRHNTSTTRPNTSTKEALAAKIGLYFALFVTELYIFLISFRNSYYSPTCNIVSTLWIPRAYNTSFQNTKQPRTYDVLLYIKLKIAIQVPKTYYPLFRVLSTTAVASKN